MSRDARILSLLILLLIAICCIPRINNKLTEVYHHALDKLDKRPAVTILFIGNSRTFYHDMPYMVRKMADSAHSPNRYEVTMHALPGVYLKDLWNDAETIKLLQQKWDYVVIQGASAENLNDYTNSTFQQYGISLANLAKQSGSKTVLYLSWQYQRGTQNYSATMWPKMQEAYYNLSVATGSDIVNAGGAWEMVLQKYPDFPLYEDGNHPKIAGAYLTALLFYKYFSGGDVNSVTYVPYDLSNEKAAQLKEIASQPVY